jgi:hypothetical protein
MMAALQDILDTLEAQADGRAEEKVYLSSLDPGIGKTTAIIKFVDRLLFGRHPNTGVIILLSRLDEIANLCDSIVIPEEMLAVCTSSPELNALGGAEINGAQVLFTTQQMLASRLQGTSFTKYTDFFYQGKPRQVRIWDEAWLPGETYMLSRDDISAMLTHVRRPFPKFAQGLDDIIDALRENTEGTYTLPDLKEGCDIDLNELLALLDDSDSKQQDVSRDRMRTVWTALWFMLGKTVSLKRDYDHETVTALTYRNSLPYDLAPLLVTDASGRVRGTYTLMEDGRKNIVRLKSAPKSYANLNTHIWMTGGGKGKWSSSGREAAVRAEGIAEAINSMVNEEWLVIVHKPSKYVDNVEPLIMEQVKGDKGRVKFITWGCHRATNSYAEIPNVVLAGTLFLRPSGYEALARLSADLLPKEGACTAEMLSKVITGENADVILQAACRGAIRKAEGTECAPSNLYVIASVRSGIPKLLSTVFPGTKVQRWRPTVARKGLTGRVKDVYDYLSTRFKDESVKEVKFKEVYETLGMSQRFFNKSMRRHSDLLDALAELDVKPWGEKVRATGFWRMSDVYDFGDD